MSTATYDSRVMRKLAPYVPATDKRGFVTITRGSYGDPGYLALDARQLLNVSCKIGREQAGQGFDAGLLQFSYPVNAAGDVAGWQVGQKVWLQIPPGVWQFLLDLPTASYDPNVYSRDYAATVSDLQLTYRRLQAGRPLQAVLDVTAVGPKARAGQTLIGDAPWPAELVNSRKNRIEDLAGPKAWPEYNSDGLYPLGTWTGTPAESTTTVVNARDVDRASALQLYEDLAADQGALVHESMQYGDRILWAALEWRDNRTPLVTLRPEEVAATARWGMGLSGLVNRYTVTYGPEGAQAELTVTDDDSIATFGEYAASRTVQLADKAKADRLARLTVGRNSRPTWGITRLDVDLLDLALPRAKAAELLHAEIGDLVVLEGMPTSAPGPRHYFIEGSELSVGVHDVRLSVFVSDAQRTGAPLSWDELPADMTWSSVPADKTWLTAAGWYVEPPATFRWSDVPGNQQWWTLAPGETRQDGDPRGPSWTSYPNDP